MLRSFLKTITLGLFVTATLAGPGRAADDPNACKIAKDGDNDIVKACKAGGIKRAKMVMKAMSKAVKEKGMKVECDSCHKNEEDWALTKDGPDKFKKMEALMKDEAAPAKK